jgi:phospholipid/cholesterol/gamma-HCH transport system permease protein
VPILRALGEFGVWSARVAFRMVTPRWEVHETARHTWTIVLRCVVPVVATVFPLGMVMALQGLSIFDMFGAQRLLPSLISVATFRELSPVLATALVTAQGGSAFAAELGAMRIQEEIDATEVMGVDPLRVHVAPRVWASLFATPALDLVGALAGVSGGWFTACVLRNQASGVYWANVWNLTGPQDLFGSLFKTLVFGLLIGLIATWRGFNAWGGEEGVGRAVNDTAVIAITTFVVLNYFLTTLLFGALG